MGELQTDQVITFRVSYPDGAGAHATGSFGQGSRGGQRGAGDFEQNPCRKRQRAADGNQSSASGNIQCGGEFEEFFSLVVAAANEDRDSEGQTYPLAAFCFRLPSVHANPSRYELTQGLQHLRGQTTGAKPMFSGQKDDLKPVIP